MKELKKCKLCGITFVLRDILQWGKKRPWNYCVINNFGEKEIYHKKCYNRINPSNQKKIRIGGGYNTLGQSFNADVEVNF